MYKVREFLSLTFCSNKISTEYWIDYMYNGLCMKHTIITIKRVLYDFADLAGFIQINLRNRVMKHCVL